MLKRLKSLFTLKNIILVTLLILFVMFLRWNSIGTPFERDEGDYAYGAWMMRQGGLPYEDIFLQKPPMIVYTYYLGQLVDPIGIVSPRILAMIFSILTALFVGLITKKYFGKNAGWASVFIFSALIASPLNSSLAANTEVFMILPLMVFVYLYVYFNKSKNMPVWFIAGIMASLTLLYKPIAPYIIAFIVFVWLYELYKAKIDFKGLFLKLFLFVIGGLLTLALVSLPFILRDGGKELWEQAVVFNSLYIKHWGFGLDAIVHQMGRLFKNYWLLFILTVYFFAKKPKKWWLFAGFLFFTILGVYQSSIYHYYNLVVPFWVIIVSGSLAFLTKEGVVKKYLSENRMIWLTFIVLAFILYPVRAQFGLTPQKLSIYIYGIYNPFSESPIVSERLRDITEKDDCVYIAGSETQILFYAKRKSCTHLVISYPFIIKTPFREIYQNESIEDLKASPPEAIVVSRRQHSGFWEEGAPKNMLNYLEELIKDDYYVVGGYVWVPKGGYWLEPLPEDEIVNSSLILYKRIDKSEE
ncbi:ArnT family glycosyltransferase [Patescibacteria group bacterium]